MADVRAAVDSLDAEIVALLAERFRFMDAAARIKPARADVRDESRKAEVVRNATDTARRLGGPAPAIATIWDALVEASIAYELEKWDSRAGKGA